uniref:Uncharacterized protein n=1 Tax=Rhizophora mucronata TaxID=61149 RepID=A0A2P2QRH1_RHIMU
MARMYLQILVLATPGLEL